MLRWCCGQVLWVMYEARCDADEKHGREYFQRKMGTQLEEGEAKERAVEEGLKYAKRDAAAYEKRVALEPAEAVERAAKTARLAEGVERVAAREAGIDSDFRPCTIEEASFQSKIHFFFKIDFCLQLCDAEEQEQS